MIFYLLVLAVSIPVGVLVQPETKYRLPLLLVWGVFVGLNSLDKDFNAVYSGLAVSAGLLAGIKLAVAMNRKR